ncbi:MAG TPA: hypothetical protein VN811_10160 [Thermoanaerobaculia bacterium]|nr:hypothetical protein [Thermoanaerobaculia bacterium]HXT51395.1 hypothetical protein [Thermoanaerobaculia bacterium]
MRPRRPHSAFRAGILVAVAVSAVALPFAAAQAQEIVTTITNEQLVAATGDYPSVALDSRGRGVVAWRDGAAVAGPVISIRARQFNGTTFGAPFQVGFPKPGIAAEDPRVAMDARGNFIVVWSEGEVHGQLFRADGRDRGIFILSPGGVGAFHPEVAMAGDGRFAVAYEQSTSDPTRSVRLATFNPRGTRFGKPVTMNAIGTMANTLGAVSASANSVAVGWTEFTPCPSNPIDPVSAVATFNWSLRPLGATDRLANDNPCVDGPQVLAMPNSDLGPLGIFVGRRYSIQRFSNADGTRVGPRTNVADLPSCAGSTCDRVLAVAGDRRGRFVFIWERFENNAYSLYGELYGREGAKRVERFAISSYDSTEGEQPAAAFTSDGTLVVTWYRAAEGVLMRSFKIE